MGGGEVTTGAGAGAGVGSAAGRGAALGVLGDGCRATDGWGATGAAAEVTTRRGGGAAAVAWVHGRVTGTWITIGAGAVVVVAGVAGWADVWAASAMVDAITVAPAALRPNNTRRVAPAAWVLRRLLVNRSGLSGSVIVLVAVV